MPKKNTLRAALRASPRSRPRSPRRSHPSAEVEAYLGGLDDAKELERLFSLVHGRIRMLLGAGALGAFYLRQELDPPGDPYDYAVYRRGFSR